MALTILTRARLPFRKRWWQSKLGLAVKARQSDFTMPLRCRCRLYLCRGPLPRAQFASSPSLVAGKAWPETAVSCGVRGCLVLLWLASLFSAIVYLFPPAFPPIHNNDDGPPATNTFSLPPASLFCSLPLVPSRARAGHPGRPYVFPAAVSHHPPPPPPLRFAAASLTRLLRRPSADRTPFIHHSAFRSCPCFARLPSWSRPPPPPPLSNRRSHFVGLDSSSSSTHKASTLSPLDGFFKACVLSLLPHYLPLEAIDRQRRASWAGCALFSWRPRADGVSLSYLSIQSSYIPLLLAPSHAKISLPIIAIRSPPYTSHRRCVSRFNRHPTRPAIPERTAT